MTKEMANAILQSEDCVRGFVFDEDGKYADYESFIGTPENIANYIGQHLQNDVTITDTWDNLIVSTKYSFLDRCPNEDLRTQILEHLIPIQVGECEAKEIPVLTSADYDTLYDQEAEDFDQDFS